MNLVAEKSQPLPGWGYPFRVYEDINSYMQKTISKKNEFKRLRKNNNLDSINIFTNGFLRYMFELDSDYLVSNGASGMENELQTENATKWIDQGESSAHDLSISCFAVVICISYFILSQ